MGKTFKTPGFYVEEITKFPPSVAQVETAIPAFIGYTQQATKNIEGDLNLKPTKITSLIEYESYFGSAQNETAIGVSVIDDLISTTAPNETSKSPFLMYYSLQMFFANGGGPCYIVSVGQYGASVNPSLNVLFYDLDLGLKEIAKLDEPTLLAFPDATSLSSDNDFYSLFKNALVQCHDLQDRFTILDTYRDVEYDGKDPIASLRSGISLDINYLKYGAVYFPFLETVLKYTYDESKIDVIITRKNQALSNSEPLSVTVKLDTLKASNNALYEKIKARIANLTVTLPPSSTIAGIYATVDANRGVWKAPANVSLNNVTKPTIIINDQYQDGLNQDPVAGKSINAIRKFTGKGTLVWGSRTLAGNDNEWRYIPVRRFINMAEESIKKATEQFVFEPNDANTWNRVKGMIENFLTQQWKNGALTGSKPDQAFFVRVGLGQTMSDIDIREGRMIIHIGLAMVRPAEFIISQFTQKMQ